AFLLCGTREDVAARAEEYHEAGMQLPVLQPVVQNDDQVEAVMGAALLYGSEGPATTEGHPAADGGMAAEAVDARVPPRSSRVRRRVGAWYEIVRPFSFTAL